MSRSKVIRTLTLVVALALVSCGGSSGNGNPSSGGAVAGPCDVTTPEVVAEAFGGSSATETEGTARNCMYEIVGSTVPAVSVFYYGPGDDWEDTRNGFEQNRGGTTDVAVGEAGFYPNSAGPRELVVLARDIIFSVAVSSLYESPEAEAAVLDLATTIASG